MLSWKKHEILGAGAFGTVYFATPFNDPSASIVAVKSTWLEISGSLQKESEFLKELRGNPNIVRCYGTDVTMEKGGFVYNLVLEYAAGGNLSSLIRRRGHRLMAETDAAHYALMLLRGIAACHECDIIHCDLKPGNVLVFPGPNGGRLKIADFGQARKESDVSGTTGVYSGTKKYLAPETIQCGVHHKATDIWGLGCIVLAMFTGQAIWTSEETSDLLYAANFAKPKERIPEYLSEECKNFLRICLKRNPCGRWSAKELMQHPFITQNLSTSSLMMDANQEEYKEIFLRESPFGKEWFSTINMFVEKEDYLYSSQPKEEQANCCCCSSNSSTASTEFQENKALLDALDLPVGFLASQ